MRYSKLELSKLLKKYKCRSESGKVYTYQGVPTDGPSFASDLPPAYIYSDFILNNHFATDNWRRLPLEKYRYYPKWVSTDSIDDMVAYQKTHMLKKEEPWDHLFDFLIKAELDSVEIKIPPYSSVFPSSTDLNNYESGVDWKDPQDKGKSVLFEIPQDENNFGITVLKPENMKVRLSSDTAKVENVEATREEEEDA